MKTKERIHLYPGLGEGEPHYLDRLGTITDLAESGLILTKGMQVPFYDIDGPDPEHADNLLFEGTVHWDANLQKWYPLIDWSSFRSESEERERQKSRGMGTGAPG